MKDKFCSKCSETKDISEFNKDRSRTDGMMIYCRTCMQKINKIVRKRNNKQRTEYNKKYRAGDRKKYNNWERNYYRGKRDTLLRKSKMWREGNGVFTMLHIVAKARAKKKKLEYQLTSEIIENLCLSQKNKCALTGLAFILESASNYRFRPFAPSIDRKNSSKGYTLDNIQIVCVIANKAKNEYEQIIFDQMCVARAERLGWSKS